jgi:hypothetical protein
LVQLKIDFGGSGGGGRINAAGEFSIYIVPVKSLLYEKSTFMENKSTDSLLNKLFNFINKIIIRVN